MCKYKERPTESYILCIKYKEGGTVAAHIGILHTCQHYTQAVMYYHVCRVYPIHLSVG